MLDEPLLRKTNEMRNVDFHYGRMLMNDDILAAAHTRETLGALYISLSRVARDPHSQNPVSPLSQATVVRRGD